MASKRLSSTMVDPGFDSGLQWRRKSRMLCCRLLSRYDLENHTASQRVARLSHSGKQGFAGRHPRMRGNRGTEKAASQNGPLRAGVADKASPLPQTISVSMGRSFDVQ
jgi:hypothetical protein